MKRTLTISLLIATLVLWGVILYRLLRAGGETPAHVERLLPVPSSVVSMDKRVVDTLLLNYEDPFLMMTGVEQIPDTAIEIYDSYPEEVPYVDWSQVQYLGSITGSEAVALVIINGHEYMLKTGETVDGYTLTNQTAMSISVRYDGQVATINMQENNEVSYHEEP